MRKNEAFTFSEFLHTGAGVAIAGGDSPTMTVYLDGSVVAGGTISEVGSGVWSFSLTAAQTNGNHVLVLIAHADLLISFTRHFFPENDTTAAEVATQTDTTLTSSHGSGNWTTSPSLGTGARQVKITVNDGTNPIEGATVRVTKGAETYVTTTDSNGEANSGSGFSLDDGDWTVTITKPLYSFTPVTLTVSDDVDQTYSMTADSFPTSDPGLVTGYLYCYDENGVVEEGAIVELKFAESTGTGVSYDTSIRRGTSNASGLVSFTNMFKGTSYKIRRGSDQAWQDLSIASDASSPLALSDCWGSDE